MSSSRGGAKTPGKPLKDILNTGTPFAATGKRSKHEDRTVDVGALLRGTLLVPKLAVPKLRSQQEQQQPQAGGAKPSLLMQPNPVYSPGVDSPDASLQQAASKLAHLKASRMGAPATARPASKPPTIAPLQTMEAPAMAAPAVCDPGHLAAMPSQPPLQPQPSPAERQPQADSPVPPSLPPHPASHAAAGTPDYRPHDRMASGDETDAVPLAARTAITKRHRRKSQHHGPERFGDWFSGDDDQLENALREYNLSQQQEQQAAAAAQEPRMTRAQRRKSALPALGRSMTADTDALGGALQREPSEEEKAADARQDVVAKVQALTSELCTRLDGLIEASPKEKGRKRKNDDDRSLHEKLVEAWDGKSYYERLKSMADKEEEEEEEEEGCKEQQEPITVPAAAAGGRQPAVNVDLPPAISAAPSSLARGAKTPGRTRRAQQQLSELTESLMKLQVSSANRTSKAAAALASKARSGPGSRTTSPSAAAMLDLGVAGNPFGAASAVPAAEAGPAKDLVQPAAAEPLLNPSEAQAQQQGSGIAKAAWPSTAPKRKEAEEGEAVSPLPPAAAPAPSAPQPELPTQVAAAAGTAAPATAAGRRPAARQLAVLPAGPKEAQQHAAQPGARVTRAKSKSPEPAAMPAAPPSLLPQPGARKAGLPAAGLATTEAAAGSSPASKPAAGAGESDLLAELEAAYKMLSTAVEGRKAAEHRAAELQGQLAAEKEASKVAQQQANELSAQLKEESKARKAAERRAKELGGQVEELQRRAEAADAAEHTLSRVAEKAQESAARYAAAEGQLAMLLKAANSLSQQLGQGRDEVQALHDMAAGRRWAGEAGALAGGPAGAGSSRPARQQQAKPALGTWR